MDVNLILFKKDGSQKPFELPSTTTVMGRRSDCDLVIRLKQVSKRHCQIVSDNGTLHVRDLGSRNGTFLNNEKIEEKDAEPGDYLRIGPLTFLLQIDGKPEKVAAPPAQSDKQAKKETPAGEAEEEDFLDFDDLDKEDGPNLGEANLDEALDDEFADLDDNSDDSFLGELEEL